MPGIMIERPKMTRTMYQALKRHIMKEREKKKQEQEQDEELARQKKERELKKKKEEENSLTLEQTKEQILQLETKLDTLKRDKHEFFSQLKRVIHQEDDSRKRAQMKENEMVQSIQQFHPIFLQGPGHMSQTKYMNVSANRSSYGSSKRPRSPSPPPPVSVYGTYHPPAKYHPTATYGSAVKPDRYQNQKSSAYSTPSSHVTYVTQPSHTFSASHHGAAAAAAAAGIYQTAPLTTSVQQQVSAKYPNPNQSAFTSYPNHYAHQQQQLKEPPPHFQPGYRVQVPPQGRAFLSSGPGGNIPLQQQLQHADKKSGFAEEKYKSGPNRAMNQHISSRQQPMMSSQPPPGLVAQQPLMVSQQPKGGITTGFPVRTQVSSSSYQPPSQAVSSSTQHPYASVRYNYK